MNNTQILVIILVLVALWIYYQSQQPKLVSKGTQTEEKETKEVGTQWEYQLSSSASSAKNPKDELSQKTNEVLENFYQSLLKKIPSNLKKPSEKVNEISSSESSLNKEAERERERERENK